MCVSSVLYCSVSLICIALPLHWIVVYLVVVYCCCGCVCSFRVGVLVWC